MKGPILCVGGIFLIVVVALVVHKESESNEHTSTALDKAIQDDSTPANWKLCINKELGYSLSYPQNWHTYGEGSYSETTLFQDSECAGKRVLISQYTAVELASGSTPDFGIQHQTVFDLGLSRYAGIQSLEEYLARNPDFAGDASRYQYTALDGRRFLWLRSFPDSPLLVSFEEGWLITVSGSASSSEDTFRAMLATLRFF